MTDTKKAALSMALAYWQNVDPANWNPTMMGGSSLKQGGNYAAQHVVDTAITFAAFLDGEKPKKGRRG